MRENLRIVYCGNCLSWQIDAPVWLTMAPPEYDMFHQVMRTHGTECLGAQGFRTFEAPPW